MKYVFLLTAIIMLISIPTLTNAQVFTFSTNLYLGSSSLDVQELQKALNKDPKTRLSNSGPGSLDNETSYFGPLTRNAVVKFQDLYASEVLHPLGLSSGTGFVGPSTREKLNFLQKSQKVQEEVGASLDNGDKSPYYGDDLEEYISIIRKLGYEQGYTIDSLDDLEKEIRSITSSGADLKERFFEEASLGLSQSAADNLSPFSRLTALFEPVVELIIPRAHALGGLETFGGRVVFTIPCTCTGGLLWNVAIGPPVPVVADYVIGTQLYLNYNFPEPPGIWALGLYSSSGSGSCFIGVPPFCATIPSQGIITPIIGTSLTP